MDAVLATRAKVVRRSHGARHAKCIYSPSLRARDAVEYRCRHRVRDMKHSSKLICAAVCASEGKGARGTGPEPFPSKCTSHATLWQGTAGSRHE